MSATATDTRKIVTERDVISCDPDVVSGTPVFKGTRVPAVRDAEKLPYPARRILLS